MFKFLPDEPTDPLPPNQPPPTTPLRTAERLEISQRHYDTASKLRSHPNGLVELKTHNLKCVNIAELGASGVATDHPVAEILNSTSDLKPGVYEGGFKTWECTYDLIAYTQEHADQLLPNEPSPLRILDLGCGSGLLGLAVLNLAASRNLDVRVDFQDYNSEVLEHVTIPNTLANFSDDTASRCRYFSGDWSSFSELIDQKYDLILSSETIYNLEYLPRFVGVLRAGLKEGACLYVAAKAFYFGVGGSTNAFLQEVRNHADLEAETVRVFKEGVKREITRVKKKIKSV